MYSDILFLLGGHDLEMTTIAELLKLHNVPFEDKNLQWDTAKLSAYQDVLDHNQDKKVIYGIELSEDDSVQKPSNYKLIDHHNDNSSQDSSLEQVLDILNISPSRYLQLVAANDRGFISAMEKLNATPDEISQIRRADRLAQGVTIEEEIIAENEIFYASKLSDGFVVKTTLSHFSPIIDRLYPYKRLLVYNDEKWCFYGDGVKELREKYEEEITQRKVFYGGGDCGYIGSDVGCFSKEEICSLVNSMIEQYSPHTQTQSKPQAKAPYSYHIFYFPFRWDIKEQSTNLFSDQVSLDNIQYSQSFWERVQEVSCDEKYDLFNEKNYYHPFVHTILYDEPSNPTNLIRHFERKEPKLFSNVKYLIKVKNRPKPYSLTVESMNLNLYGTGVGFLSFYLRNDDIDQSSPEDILLINQFGRRIMPPFWADIENRYEIAEYISIKGLFSDIYNEDFKQYTPNDYWRQSSFINFLITELASNITISPIIDDRMYVASWYKNDELANQFYSDDKAYCDSTNPFSSFWYKYLFVDSSFETCQNSEMKEELLKKHTYLRWQKFHSLYGVSKYSFVYLTNTGADDFLFKNFETMYARMVELVLVQRASMLRFSAEVTKVSNFSNQDINVISSRVSSLYKEYIRFINQIYFREVSAQDQGIELYNMFHYSVKIPDYITDLDGEIEELHQYISLKEDQSHNEKATFLNNIATFFLPASFIIGIWGTNSWSTVEENFDMKLLTTLIGIIIAICIIFNRRKKL